MVPLKFLACPESRIGNDYQFNTMFRKYFSSSLVVDFSLFSSAHSAWGLAFVKECDFFGVLPFVILYDQIKFGIVRVYRQSYPRIAGQKAETMLSFSLLSKNLIAEADDINFV